MKKQSTSGNLKSAIENMASDQGELKMLGLIITVNQLFSKNSSPHNP